jgi:IS5 family transposase
MLSFRRRLEEHKLAEQILAPVNKLLSQRSLLPKTVKVVDATLVAAPAFARNKDRACDPNCTRAKRASDSTSV